MDTGGAAQLRRSSRVKARTGRQECVDSVSGDSLLPTTSQRSSKGDRFSMANFSWINENLYSSVSKSRIVASDCNCLDLHGSAGCKDDCLNWQLKVECEADCRTGVLCSNQRLQRREYANLKIFKTDLKGYGLKAVDSIPAGALITEYVGEVLDSDALAERQEKYAREKRHNFYFMALGPKLTIDACQMGNTARCINHSCKPNCATEKWVVNGIDRIGIIALQDIPAGEEVTFDYRIQRYGSKAQRCYCQSEKCRGKIGEDTENEAPELQVSPTREHQQLLQVSASLPSPPPTSNSPPPPHPQLLTQSEVPVLGAVQPQANEPSQAPVDRRARPSKRKVKGSLESEEPPTKKYKCSFCSLTFKYPAFRDTHVRETHERVTRVQCNLCVVSTSNKSNLLKHMRNKHNA